MLIDISPLRRHRDFRLLYTGQFVSFFGSMITYVAVPYQVYHLTHSSFAVGLIGVVQLVPLLFTAFMGGALSDSMDRRKLLLNSEFLMALASLLLMVNALLPRPQAWLVFALSGAMSALNGFHRPALEAITPRLVTSEDIPAVSALSSLRGTIGMVAGPAVGGLLIARYGLPSAFGADVISYLVSLLAVSLIRAVPPKESAGGVTWTAVLEGLRYARGRQELIGTYVVDMVAMIFGMPMALFPAIAESMGGAAVLGWLYAAPSAGAFAVSLLSAWTKKVTRHGAAILWAAGLWGVAILAFGFCHNLYLALLLLALAGGADMVSAIFRLTIWNETIPDRLRGRMASVEMLSYMSGPLLGNAEAGLVASLTSVSFSVISGGVLCIVGVALCGWLLPGFASYDTAVWKSREAEAKESTLELQE